MRLCWMVTLLLGQMLFWSCNSSTPNYQDPYNQTEEEEEEEEEEYMPKLFKILALGDSYTIGQSVCESCRFPAQLVDSLKTYYEPEDEFTLQIIATTGWTTSNLIQAINTENPTNDFDLVTLLIGVNNQYQNKPFSLYESEFPSLVQMALSRVNNRLNKLIVLSIPDYAYTPFGQAFSNPSSISTALENYNNFAQNYCEANGIHFVNITDITQEGLNSPNLVASDNLHPSTLAYSRFVERLLPLALANIE